MNMAFTMGNLHIDWKVILKPVFPIDAEFKKIKVELSGLFFIKDPEYRNCFDNLHKFSLL